MMKAATVAAAVVMLAGGASQALALQTVKATQAVASFSFLPADYAQDAGYFKAEGLDVKQIATRGGGPDLTALISGDVNFNFGVGVYEINALLSGRKLVNVLNMERRSSIGVVLSKAAAEKTGVKPDAPLKARAAALKGLRIGMTRPGSLTDKQVRHLMAIGGLKKGDVQIVAIGGPQSLIAGLTRGQLDGYAISVPWDRYSVEKGLAVQWVDNPAGQDPSIDPFLMSSLVTTPEMVAQHKDLVRAMVKALRHAIADIIAKPPAEIRKVIAKRYAKVDAHVLDVGLAAAKKLMNPTGEMTLKMAENTVRYDGRNASAEALYKTFDPEFLK
jgi:NitT/TauT family transport system substrate-binding protein